MKKQNSTDLHDLHTVGLHYLSQPFLTRSEASFSFYYFNKSYSEGNIESAPFVAYLYFYGLGVQTDLIQSVNILEEKCDQNDPWRLDIFSEIISTGQVKAEASIIQTILLGAVKTGHIPSIYKYAFSKRYGLYDLERDSNEAFQLFSKSAANGYLKSMVSIAHQFLGGDGVISDPEQSLKYLRRVFQSLPLFKILNKYVERNSTHAFLRVLDLGLIPEKWVKVESKSPTIKKLLYFSKSLSKIREINPEIKQKAESGDNISILWMALNSEFLESLNWIKKMKDFNFPSSFISEIIKYYKLGEALFKYYHGELAFQEKVILFENLKEKSYILLISISFIAFFGFLWLRLSVNEI